MLASNERSAEILTNYVTWYFEHRVSSALDEKKRVIAPCTIYAFSDSVTSLHSSSPFNPDNLFHDCRAVATPLASLLGVKDTARLKAPYNPTLESYYCNITKNPTQVDVHTHTQLKGQSVVPCVLPAD